MDNKQAYLFILWIYKSYGLFFSTPDSHKILKVHLRRLAWN